MNREEFNAVVIASYKKFEDRELSKDPKQIYCDAYEIAKITSLKDYLTEYDCFDMERLYPYAETILNDLYEYEWGYDTPQWCELDDISNMIDSYIEEL